MSAEYLGKPQNFVHPLNPNAHLTFVPDLSKSGLTIPFFTPNDFVSTKEGPGRVTNINNQGIVFVRPIGGSSVLPYRSGHVRLLGKSRDSLTE